MHTGVISVLIWLLVKRQEKKLKELKNNLQYTNEYKILAEEFKESKTEHPMALCISTLRDVDSLKPVVKSYLTQNDIHVKGIEEIKMDGINNEKDVETFIGELQKCKRSALSEATEIRLFIAGPVQIGTLTGGILSNWRPVLLYHKGRVTYEYWGPLYK